MEDTGNCEECNRHGSADEDLRMNMNGICVETKDDKENDGLFEGVR